MKLRINDRTKHTGRSTFDVMSGRTWLKSFSSREEAQAFINDRETGRDGESDNVGILRRALLECPTEMFIVDDTEHLFNQHWKMEALSRNQPEMTNESAPFNQPRPRLGGN